MSRFKLDTSTSPTVDRFHRVHETTFNGRHVTPGCELTIIGQRGRCRFRALVTNAQGDQWVDVVDVRGLQRSFAVDRVKTVHRIDKTRENAT